MTMGGYRLQFPALGTIAGAVSGYLKTQGGFKITGAMYLAAHAWPGTRTQEHNNRATLRARDILCSAAGR